MGVAVGNICQRWLQLSVPSVQIVLSQCEQPDFPGRKNTKEKEQFHRKSFSKWNLCPYDSVAKEKVWVCCIEMMGNFSPRKQLCAPNPPPGKSGLVWWAWIQSPPWPWSLFTSIAIERASGLRINTALPLKWMFDNVSLITCSSFPSSNLGPSSWHLPRLQQHSQQQPFNPLLSRDRTTFVMDARPVHWVT